MAVRGRQEKWGESREYVKKQRSEGCGEGGGEGADGTEDCRAWGLILMYAQSHSAGQLCEGRIECGKRGRVARRGLYLYCAWMYHADNPARRKLKKCP